VAINLREFAPTMSEFDVVDGARYRSAIGWFVGDSESLDVFAAVHESVHGTFETSSQPLGMSAYRGRPEVGG
jgi:hypothetical protein